MPPVVLVTGTDTGVGKTVTTAALVALLAPGRSVAVLKPTQTGVRGGEPGDIDDVRRLTGHPHLHEGVRLIDPLAPTTAARREGRSIPSVADHAATVGRLLRDHDTVLVEGAGGLLVGLDGDGRTLADLAHALDAPCGCVVVTRAGLGTLNHTALTVEALRRRDLPVLGLVVGAAPQRPGLAEQCNLLDLPRTAAAPLLGRIPEGAGGLTADAFLEQAPSWFDPPLG
ncbi:MAG: dethiobiotin synthase [Nocardioidaceae bacterium]